MHTIKTLSIIGLAAYLTLQGLFYLSEFESPMFHAAIGLLALASGVLMFISLNHWIEHSKKK